MVHDARLAALLSELPPHRVYRILGKIPIPPHFGRNAAILRAEFYRRTLPRLIRRNGQLPWPYACLSAAQCAKATLVRP